MNKLDKQFEEMMKGGVKLNSPSSDFTLKVMSRVYAEAAVKPKRILQDYQPVISKKAWMILIVAFVALMIYITVSGQPATQGGRTGFWSTVSEKMGSLQANEASSILKTGTGLFTSIPTITYLILIAALALWTLDGFFNKLRHQHSDLQTN